MQCAARDESGSRAIENFITVAGQQVSSNQWGHSINRPTRIIDVTSPDHRNESECNEPDRRRFLKIAGAAAAATAAASPLSAIARPDDDDDGVLRVDGPDDTLPRKIRSLFILDRQTTYMNIGTTGSMPRRVLKNYNEYNRLVAEQPWDMGGEWGGFPYTGDLVARMAPQFGCADSELVISRNTTDGMVSVLHGLDLQPGDHVIATHHEHVAGTSPLWVLADRIGIDVEYVDIPVFPPSEQEYVDVIAAAVRPETRLIVMSHITYKTGAVLPVKRICDEIAVPSGIVTLIDGAHASGMLNIDLHDINCDFYAASGHKWQCGPGGTGLLYVRDNASRVSDFWPGRKPMWAINSSLAHLVSIFGWQTALQYKGNDNYPALRALADACDLWGRIGRDRIEAHDKHLSTYTKQLIKASFDDPMLYSPDVPELTSGISSFNPFPDQTDSATLTSFRDRLREEYGFIIRTTDFEVAQGLGNVYALRISTHLFHDERDVEGLVDAMAHLYRRMSPSNPPPPPPTTN
jgi:selenocysteine lyase/cysteine desulfurase